MPRDVALPDEVHVVDGEAKHFALPQTASPCHVFLRLVT
ncbi:hypothetical protein EDD92_0142 [Streptomyces sp. TLI_185]|nr:hypothetical protein EDD92_0142 [Streptomyces sp. TLI_185]